MILHPARPRLLGLFAVLMLGCHPAGAAEHMVTVDGGRAPMSGTLLSVDSPVNGIAVLFLPGSGPTDRDGNSRNTGITTNTTRQLAAALAAAGITSLRYDKRGIGESASAMVAEDMLTFDTSVQDALLWHTFLSRQPGVRCVALVGHSEGALIALLAAQRAPACGLASLAGPGRNMADLLKEQLAAQPLPPALRQQARLAIDELLAGRRVPAPPPQLLALLRPSVQPYLISVLPIDPAAELRKLNLPVLIVQGDTDLQVSTADAQRLKAARPDAELLLLRGVNHVLKQAPSERNANLATYANGDLPVDAGVTEALVRFVKGLHPGGIAPATKP